MTDATVESLASRYRGRRALAVLLLACGLAALAISSAMRLGADWRGCAAAVLVAVVIALLVSLLAPRIDAPLVARHLDRIAPELEESASLLLTAEDELPLLDRLERRRVTRALAGWEPPRLPDRFARLAALAGSSAILLAIALVVVPGSQQPARASRPATVSADPGAARVVDLTIEIRPPAYMGLPVRRQDDWTLEVEEGARVLWTLELDRAIADDAVTIITTAGDTIPLESAGERRFAGEMIARSSALYHLTHDGSPAIEYRQLMVHPDDAPAVTVLRPAPRSEIGPGASRLIAVEILAVDDHGARGAELVATVTTGDGEGVRFREQRIPIAAATRAQEGRSVYRHTLDLDALGMAPGDDLYFHALVRDARTPRPNEGRSETVFLSLQDTSAAIAADFAGLGISALPEYFRSQRQIIIDTERLIADAPRLPVQIFRERANAIGIDQGLLRLRYGQFTGEEFEAGIDDDEVHDHDNPENATLLATSVKTRLKGAIAEMWEAELRLRTYRPREALPFELRALELLKSVQQEARAYVQRVGFAPPPLEPDEKRLSGELDGIRSRTVRDSVSSETLPAVRAALARVRLLSDGDAPRPSDALMLERASTELAALAMDDPARHLEGLRNLSLLRNAVADSGAQGPELRAAASRAERALLHALPAPVPAVARSGSRSSLARRYFELLGREP